MRGSALEAVLKRDRAIVLVALAGLTALAWTYTLWLAWRPGMGMPSHGWTLVDAWLAFIMWTVMMVGMMTPSAAPMILIYARVARQSAGRRAPLVMPVGLFTTGYLLAWLAFSVFATVGQWMLHDSGLLSPMMRVPGLLAGPVLIAAGLFQWTAAKQACLRHCQSPLVFIQRHGGFRPGARAALALGIHHGAYCVGCCWMLMALLFVGGVMNTLWIAGLSAFVLAEKVLPPGRWFPRTAGTGLVAAGIWSLASAFA